MGKIETPENNKKANSGTKQNSVQPSKTPPKPRKSSPAKGKKGK